MGYKVISAFKDTDDNLTNYAVGDDYPNGKYKPTKKRIVELTEKHPKYKRVFIKEVETEEEKNTREAVEKATAEQIAKEEAEAKNKAEEEKDTIRTELESLGVSAHPNTGLEKLKEKLEEAKAEKANKE